MPQEPKDTPQTGQLEGRYANYFQIGHNAFEFVLDFGQVDVEGQTVRFHTRIITAPAHVRIMFELLQKSIERYTQTFGAIPQGDE